MFAMLPVILAVSSYGSWYVMKTIRKWKEDISGKAMSTLVIVLFLVHPNII